MMTAATYAERRGRLQTYFDATAVKAWAQLTSDAPVSRIRETVRQGRERMRSTILSWLPADLSGQPLLDAGCGTGALAVAAAERGARVTAIDIAGNLVALAQERAPAAVTHAIDFQVGDLLNPGLGAFAHVVAMDSLIHYPKRQIVAVIAELAPRTSGSIIFTIAPQTPMLSVMHGVGLLFPRSDRAPAIEPVAETSLCKAIAAEPALKAWRVGRTQRISRGFYTSQALELVRR
jgi:magnesium-protoporphyrin O-methyltransferase